MISAWALVTVLCVTITINTIITINIIITIIMIGDYQVLAVEGDCIVSASGDGSVLLHKFPQGGKNHHYHPNPFLISSIALAPSWFENQHYPH